MALSSGFLLINKPEGPTTFQLLAPLRKKWRGHKIGHAGTLDAGASGLVIAAVGKASRLLSLVEAEEKEYSFRLHLGFRTDTGDLTGKVVEKLDHFTAAPENIEKVLPKFIGEQLQQPPLYSALKVDGKRASDRVRAGEEVVLKPREIVIRELELLPAGEGDQLPYPCFDLRAVVSKGTYIRALGRDLAEAMGGIGTVSRIRRLRIGSASLHSSWNWSGDGEIPELISPEELLSLPRLTLSSPELHLLRNGVRIALSRVERESSLSEGDFCFLFDEAGELQLLAALRRGCDPYSSSGKEETLLLSPQVQLLPQVAK